MTEFIKKKDVKKSWYKIDATNLIVGRLASEITKILRGTKKTSFTPNMDDGDFVIVTNARKIKFTGKKFSNKIYYKHTGYPGGIKETTPNQILQKDPSRIIKLAVKRMLPRGPLGRKQLGNLKVYNDEKHPHETQKAVDFDFKSRNKKNSLKYILQNKKKYGNIIFKHEKPTIWNKIMSIYNNEICRLKKYTLGVRDKSS